MTIVRVQVQLHNPAVEPREVRRDFTIDRDLVADPIEPGEVLHLGTGLASNLLVSAVYGGDPHTVGAIVTEIGMNVDARW